MAKTEFRTAVNVKTTPERAFDYFADYRHVADVLGGIRQWQPIGDRTSGVGARYRVEMEAFGFPLRNVLRIDRWQRGHEIGWISESGLVKQEGGFTFTKRPDGVRIELHIAYEPPASVVGAAAARTLDGMVRRRLDTALERIREVLEA